MTEKYFRNWISALIIGTGIILTLMWSTLNTIVSRADNLAAAVSYSGPVGQYQIPTPTPTPEAISHPGSTDGIMLMGIIIVIIVLLPIIFRRSTWTK
jgi:hypothetical protein